MRILFVSRAYPPVTGGIENQNFGLAKSLSEIARTTVFANTRGKKFLPVFLPYATLRLILTAWRYDAILMGDGVLAPLGLPIKWLYPRIRVASVIHGLDITFIRKPGLLGKVYRFVNIPVLKRLDLLIAVGNQTVEEALAVGVARERCVFIPNGIFPEEFATPHTREELEQLVGIPLAGKKVIARVGRYVKHKGVEWFIRNVLPKLPEDVMFVAAGAVVAKATAGDQSYYPQCVKAARETGLKDRVVLLTNLPWNDIKTLYATADLVVSPNIPVPGSLEGFGINIIEAGASGAVVVASRLEGLRDAIIEGETGYFVEPLDAQGYADRITALLADDTARRAFGAHAQEVVAEQFSWDGIARKYVEALEKTLPS